LYPSYPSFRLECEKLSKERKKPVFSKYTPRSDMKEKAIMALNSHLEMSIYFISPTRSLADVIT
jgi:hypothetical protein